MKFLTLLAIASATATPVWVGHFAAPGAVGAPWKMIPYEGKPSTAYRVANVGGRIAIEARFDRSMSLMARPIDIDLSAADPDGASCFGKYLL